MAEGVGFEPTVALRLRLISSQVPSTTQPPFRHPRFYWMKLLLRDFNICVFNTDYQTGAGQLLNERQQQSFDFLEAAFGILFGEAREFAAERDEIVVARDL